MLEHNKSNKVYLACGVTDMRKSINGLASLVHENIQLDPFEKAYFVFCNRQRNRVKILTWDCDGFWLYLKRLERGHFNILFSSPIKILLIVNCESPKTLANTRALKKTAFY